MMPFTCLRDTSPVASTTALMRALLLIEPGFLALSAFFAAMRVLLEKMGEQTLSAHNHKKACRSRGERHAEAQKQVFRRHPSRGLARNDGEARGFSLICRRFCVCEQPPGSPIVKKQS